MSDEEEQLTQNNSSLQDIMKKWEVQEDRGH